MTGSLHSCAMIRSLQWTIPQLVSSQIGLKPMFAPNLQLLGSMRESNDVFRGFDVGTFIVEYMGKQRETLHNTLPKASGIAQTYL